MPPDVSEATDKVDFKSGEIGHLASTIGTLDYESVLGDPKVAMAIERMMGPIAALLQENLQDRIPIDFVRGALVLRGQALDQAGQFGAAQVWVQLYDAQVGIALMHRGAVTAYTEYLWESDWIVGFRMATRDMAAPYLFEPLPETFTWIHRGQLRDIAEF